MRILLATNNISKVSRVRSLLPEHEWLTPQELSLEALEPEEGSDILENARNKAQAYKGKTDLPIVGMDSAFVIEGETIDPAKVKRNALEGKNSSLLSQEEIAKAMIAYYGAIAAQHAGKANAHWDDAFAIALPDGTIRESRGQRPVLLTGDIHEPIDIHMPLRAMYRVVATDKYPAEQSSEEERQELEPYRNALLELFS